MTTGPQTFAPLGALPTGTTVLEASAGTGKTWTIATLATRYVAEGVAELSQLMLVTFGRGATQELRERTRQRLTSAALALRDPAAARAGGDDLLVHLALGDDETVGLRRRRLLRALSDFDAATIATTHSFCQRMLDGLGTAGEREPGARVVEDTGDLLAEVVDDLYLQLWSGHDAPEPLLSAADAHVVARAAVADRHATLVPDDADPATSPGQRVALAAAARAELERRKRDAALRDYDDLLVLLRDVIADPAHGPAACARIRRRYRVVLVDEFQDTDPVQWEVLRRVFHGATALVLIGDPKQAIYGFRGAEVLSYLEAVRCADTHRTLSTNRRSDVGLLDALQHLYGGAALGHPAIVVQPVEAAHQGSRIGAGPPLRLRRVPRTGAGPMTAKGFPAVAALRRRVADDLAAEVLRLLESGAELRTAAVSRPVAPGDVAVLVRTRGQLLVVREALDRVGVPTVVTGSTSVFATRGARDWLVVLRALEQPHRVARVRLAALTLLVGRTAGELAEDDHGVVGQVGGLLRELAALFATAGPAAVFERLAARTDLDGRLLAVRAGERDLTDLRHVAQALHRAALLEGHGLSALTGWLSERVREPSAGSASERSRRLESDAAAVQLATVHASKGLEFPVVYLPFAWDAAAPTPTTLLLHDQQGRRLLDVGGDKDPGHAARKQQHDADGAGEELRLLYVSLTRAMCRLVLWWAPSGVTASSPLHRLILGRGQGQATPDRRPPVPSDEAVGARLQAWAAASGGLIDVDVAGGPSSGRWQGDGPGAAQLAVARAARTPDPTWRRTSYSALTAAAHDATGPGVRDEAEAPGTTDERDTESARGPSPSPLPPGLPAVASPFQDLPAGAAFGTLVHEVLERVDTATADLDVEVLSRCREAVRSRGAGLDVGRLAEALQLVLRTPLGPGLPTLGDVRPADRLAELAFELPLGGGDHPAGEAVTLRRAAALLRRHLPPDDPLAAYADRLEQIEAPPLRGYLTGSIDAVLRLPGPAYVVIDHKTNRLGAGDLTGLLTTADYTREAMAREMLRAHYPLQALLYAVALHRYLRWRQPGYTPQRHLGGVRYLFLRGMAGPTTPAGCGVFDWHPPAALVTELSDLLAGS